MTDLLIIGYGNDLRSDDGAGRAVAEKIADLALPGVEVLSVSQLTPELALHVSGRARVLFVDADVDADKLTVRGVSAGEPGTRVMTHHGDPAQLLTLAATVGTVPEEAYLMSIPAADLDVGFTFSPRTERAVRRAISFITELASADPPTISHDVIEPRPEDRHVGGADPGSSARRQSSLHGE